MLRDQVRVGMNVRFGRPNGEQTLGIVVKLNPTKAKVQTLEGRGIGHGSHNGAVWSVPYSMMQLVGDAAQPPKLEFNPAYSAVEAHILLAIHAIYVSLEPENLSHDGELPPDRVRQRYIEFTKQLHSLQAALGREVTESEVYNWVVTYKAHQNRQRQAVL